MDDQPHNHHRLIWAPVLSLTGVLAQYTVNLLTASMLNSMASPPTPAPTSKNAVWTDKETRSLVCFLHQHHSKQADGVNFKVSLYKEAAIHIMPLYDPRRGGPCKTDKTVKTKWTTNVSPC